MSNNPNIVFLQREIFYFNIFPFFIIIQFSLILSNCIFSFDSCLIAANAKHSKWYRRSPGNPRFTYKILCLQNYIFFNPSRCMFLAAFMSLSCVFPHCGHVHILLSSFNLSLWYWQLLHVLLEGYHWSMCISVRPCSYAFCSSIFVNMCHDFFLYATGQSAVFQHAFDVQCFHADYLIFFC